MVKMKITRNFLKNYKYVIKVGYCELSHLLYFHDAKFYNSDVYGWNYDVYDFGNIAILTGYRYEGNRNINYKTCKLYDTRAREIIENVKDFEEKKQKIELLINDFINEFTKNYEV